jgi:hypothetical protein
VRRTTSESGGDEHHTFANQFTDDRILAGIRKRTGEYLVGTARTQRKLFEAELLKKNRGRRRPEADAKIAKPQGEETYMLCSTAGRREKEKAMRSRFSFSLEGLSEDRRGPSSRGV